MSGALGTRAPARARPRRGRAAADSSRGSCARRCAPAGSLPARRFHPRARSRASSASRAGVVEAYDQLVAEGYLAARQGAPTRVAEAAFRPPGGAGAGPAGAAPRFDFRPGAPDVALFPRARWLASLRRALRDAPDARFDYGDPRGAPELRDALAATWAGSAAWPASRRA